MSTKLLKIENDLFAMGIHNDIQYGRALFTGEAILSVWLLFIFILTCMVTKHTITYYTTLVSIVFYMISCIMIFGATVDALKIYKRGDNNEFYYDTGYYNLGIIFDIIAINIMFIMFVLKLDFIFKHSSLKNHDRNVNILWCIYIILSVTSIFITPFDVFDKWYILLIHICVMIIFVITILSMFIKNLNTIAKTPGISPQTMKSITQVVSKTCIILYFCSITTILLHLVLFILQYGYFEPNYYGIPVPIWDIFRCAHASFAGFMLFLTLVKRNIYECICFGPEKVVHVLKCFEYNVKDLNVLNSSEVSDANTSTAEVAPLKP